MAGPSFSLKLARTTIRCIATPQAQFITLALVTTDERPIVALMSRNASASHSARRVSFSYHLLFKIGRFVVTAALIYWVIQKLDWRQVWSNVLTAQFRWLSLALLYPFFTIAIDALRWQLLLRAMSRRIAWSKLVLVNLVGMFFDNFLPGSIASDAYRTVYVSQQYAPREVLTTVLLGRVLGWVGLMTFGLLGLLALQSQLPPNVLWSGLLALGGGLCAITLGFSLLIILPRWHTYSWYHRLLLKWGYLALFIKSINQLLTCRTVLLSLSLSWLLHAVVIATVVVIAKAYGVLSEQLFSVACAAPLGILATMLPIAIAGHGIRETAFIYFLAHLGIMPEVALAMSISLYVTSAVASLIGGGVYIFDAVAQREQDKHLSTQHTT